MFDKLKEDSTLDDNDGFFLESVSDVDHTSKWSEKEDIPTLFNEGSYSRALVRPEIGSVIGLATRQGVKKKDVEDWLTKKWFRNLTMCIFDPDVDPWTYAIVSLVGSHQTALDHAEYSAAVLRPDHPHFNADATPFSNLSLITGKDIQNSADVAAFLRGTLRRVPHIIDHIVTYVTQ